MRGNRLSIALAFLLLTASCSRTPALDKEEQKYVNLTVDILRARSIIDSVNDTAKARASLHAIYAKYRTTETAYKAFADRLPNNPKHALMIYAAVKDSLKLK